MNKVKITNGFYNHGQDGLLLTGILLDGKVKKNDILIFCNNLIPIIDVEIDDTTFPGRTHIRLMISRDYNIQFYKGYGKEYEIDSN